jgi:hypothetical protein
MRQNATRQRQVTQPPDRRATGYTHPQRRGLALGARVSEFRWGEPLLESAVSGITAEGSCVSDRRVIELIEPFEAVTELLWTGELVSAAYR